MPQPVGIPPTLTLATACAAVARELAAVPDSVHEAREVCGMDTTQLGTDFLGVLLNPPWHAHVTPTHLAALRLDRVCPLGFIFVWVEKEVLSEVMDVFAKASFQYVENLTWVQMTPANRVRACSGEMHLSQAGRS